MDIRRKITQGKSLTPTEQQLGQTALAMGEDVRGLSIKEFAACANVSVASVHRFCKKLGLEGFKDLKVELIRQATEAGNRRDVDINFPFDACANPVWPSDFGLKQLSGGPLHHEKGVLRAARFALRL